MSRRKDLPEIKDGELVQPENVEQSNQQPYADFIVPLNEPDTSKPTDEKSIFDLNEKDWEVIVKQTETDKQQAKVLADYKGYLDTVKFISNEPDAETVPDFETEVRQLEKEIDERIERLNKLKGDTIFIRSKVSVDEFKAELNVMLSNKDKDILKFIKNSGFPVSYVYEQIVSTNKKNTNLFHILDVAGVLPSHSMLEAHKSFDTHGVRFYLLEDDVYHLGREVKKVLNGDNSQVYNVETQPTDEKISSVDSTVSDAPADAINPSHYGYTPGKDNPYEVYKIMEHFGLHNDAYLFNVVKYILRNGKKAGNSTRQELGKAQWYMNAKIRVLDAEEK